MNDDDQSPDRQLADPISRWQQRWQTGTAAQPPLPVTDEARRLNVQDDSHQIGDITFHTQLDLHATVAATTGLASRPGGPKRFSFGKIRAKQITPAGAILTLGYYSRTSYIHSNPTHLHLGFSPVLQGTLISVVPHWSGGWVDTLSLASIVLGLFFAILIGGAQAATVYGGGWFLLVMPLALALPALAAKFGRGWIRSKPPTTVNMVPITEIMESLFDAVEVK